MYCLDTQPVITVRYSEAGAVVEEEAESDRVAIIINTYMQTDATCSRILLKNMSDWVSEFSLLVTECERDESYKYIDKLHAKIRELKLEKVKLEIENEERIKKHDMILRKVCEHYETQLKDMQQYYEEQLKQTDNGTNRNGTDNGTNRIECAVCLEYKEKDFAFVIGIMDSNESPCGHIVCAGCSINLYNCPMCQKPIKYYTRIYF